jgi:hypothetical protein
MLGATKADGVPADLFTSGEARSLGLLAHMGSRSSKDCFALPVLEPISLASA